VPYASLRSTATEGGVKEVENATFHIDSARMGISTALFSRKNTFNIERNGDVLLIISLFNGCL